MLAMKRLSDDDRTILAKLLGKDPESISREDIMNTPKVQKRIEELSEFHSKWFSKGKGERLSQWRGGDIHLDTAANMAHKLRFVPHASYTAEESELLVALSGKNGLQTELTAGELDKVRRDLTKHVSINGSYYQPTILALFNFNDRLGVESLLPAARRQAMFNTILDAFSVERTDVRFGFDDDSFISSAASDGSPNEDSCSSVHLNLGNGGTIIMDAVFDGVGGGDKGTVESMTNAQRASAIAKSVFEISAAAGWISTPEDVRRTLVMADLAILSEQLRSKESVDISRENDMATTASVTFMRGNEFYGIHAGDSVWKVMRGGKVIMENRPHDVMFQLLCTARSMVVDEWKNADRGTDNLAARELEEFELAVAKKLADLKRCTGALIMDAVVSTLGDATHIQINNVDKDPVPIILEKNDLVLNASDGLHKRVCDHEVDMIFRGASMDTALASGQLLALAEGRMPRLCRCEVSGEEDDKTFVLRKVEGK